MPRSKMSPNPRDPVWFVVVPQQDFVEPQFHFGERVQWAGENDQGAWRRQAGCIQGMTFTPAGVWEYHIQPDTDSTDVAPAVAIIPLVHRQAHQLTRITAATPVQSYLQPPSDWLQTAAAAQVLGISAEQLRKLRSKGLFKVGTHCRDTSIPGSGLPRWQWHIERCQQALAIHPAKRAVRFNK